MVRFLLPLLLLSLAVPTVADEQQTSFRDEIAPILVRNCLGCHNDKKAEGGLNMSTFALLLKGGDVLPGESIVPGEPDSSYLIELVRPDGVPRMPYKLDPLPADAIATLERWVREGATFDGPSRTETALASLVDPLADLPDVALTVPTSEPVTAAAFTPDGLTLAAARGGDVLLFDVATRDRVDRLRGHPGRITSLRITPDGRRLIAAGGRPGLSGVLTIWNLRDRRLIQELRGHDDDILATALSPDGSTLATASYDRQVKLWDVASGRELRTLREHTDAVHGVAFSPDGTRLATASGDRTVKVWDVASGARRATLSDATAEQYAVAFSPDGKTVLGAGVDRTIRVWAIEGEDARLERQVIAHDGAILKLVVGPDGSTLVSCGEDRAIKFWGLPSLNPRFAIPPRPDWPLALALSPDGMRLAVGLYDGALTLFDSKDGTEVASLLEAPKSSHSITTATGEGTSGPTPEVAKPELVRDATLNPPSPRGTVRGGTVRVTLSGIGLEHAREIVVPGSPGITTRILPVETPTPKQLVVEWSIAPDARPGVHRFAVRTPLGTTPYQNFVISADPETKLEEGEGSTGPLLDSLPATLLGAIDTPGDIDEARFDAKAGDVLTVDVLAQGIGSRLDPVITVCGPTGEWVAEARGSGQRPDPRLIVRAQEDGQYSLRVEDAQFGGSANHLYRLTIGSRGRARNVFPLGVQIGTTAELTVEGTNLATNRGRVVSSPRDEAGRLVTVELEGSEAMRGPENLKVVLADGPQTVESSDNDELSIANPVPLPGGVSGHIERPGDVDLYRFEAKADRPVVVEVFGRRLGTEIDPLIEVVDAQGQSLPRAVLRPVAETHVAFRDHGSNQRNIRLTVWNDLEVGDFVLVGRELMRLTELPRNPDDDAIFWGLGLHRTDMGERVAFLETTPEQHFQGQSIYKVEVHPPGTTFPPGGVPPVTLPYRNDDGGPGFEGDAHVTFDPPADGTYFVRVEDARGFGGEDYGYHLVVRRPHPDFELSLSTENPNVPRGGHASSRPASVASTGSMGRSR